MKTARILTAFSLLALSASCVSTDMTQLSQVSYSSSVASAIMEFETEDDVPGNYDKLALFKVEASTFMTSRDSAIDKVKGEAAELGANAIVVTDKHDSPWAGEIIAIRLLPLTGGMPSSRAKELELPIEVGAQK